MTDERLNVWQVEQRDEEADAVAHPARVHAEDPAVKVERLGDGELAEERGLLRHEAEARAQPGVRGQAQHGHAAAVQSASIKVYLPECSGV